MSTKLFKCALSNNIIEIKFAEYNPKEAIFDYCQIDDKYIKLFFVLLRECIDSLTQSKIETIIQCVTKDDWEMHLHDINGWKLLSVSEETGNHIIQCKTSDALICIAKGFGL